MASLSAHSLTAIINTTYKMHKKVHYMLLYSKYKKELTYVLYQLYDIL